MAAQVAKLHALLSTVRHLSTRTRPAAQRLSYSNRGSYQAPLPHHTHYRQQHRVVCGCRHVRRHTTQQALQPHRLVLPAGSAVRYYSRYADEEEEAFRDAAVHEEWLEDAEYRETFEEHYLLPVTGHRVAVLQPDYKIPDRKNRLTTPQMQLDEAATLIETLPRWKVVDKALFSVKHYDKVRIWGKGNFEEITERLRSVPSVTAVLVGVNMLTGLQLATLQQAWGVPIYDRYTVVLQIFQTRARTKEAKLQVALAEIPYLRSRLRGIHKGSLGHQQGGMFCRGDRGQVPMDVKKQLLQDRELKLKAALQKVQSQRELLKKERKRRQIPTVAVVGYTNAGKTSLIRALTGDTSVVPRDQLFATLDVTVHQGELPSRMSVLYVDTVGFISDIPTDLIASFSATLRDMLEADVIIVVNDVSHPDMTWQHQTVQDTLKSLQLPEKLSDNIIYINNKVDLLPSEPNETGDETADAGLAVSAVTGQGLLTLQAQVEEAVISSTDRLRKKLRIPMSGQHLSWLYKEATVAETRTADDSGNSLMVDVIMTPGVYARFKQEFGRKAKKASR